MAGFTTVILCRGGTWDKTNATFTGSSDLIVLPAMTINFRWKNQLLFLPKPVSPALADTAVASGASFVISGNLITLGSVASIQGGMSFITGGVYYLITSVLPGTTQIKISPTSNEYPTTGAYEVKRRAFNMATNLKRITETVTITGMLQRADASEIWQKRDVLLRIAGDDSGVDGNVGLALRPVAGDTCDTRFVDSISAVTDLRVDEDTTLAEPSYDNRVQMAKLTLTLQRGLNRTTLIE